MGFLDNLSKTLSSGTDRVKFEADKFQRTTKINGEIANLKSQIDTNLRQLGERALEMYGRGEFTAPEVASLAQIMTQLKEQQAAKEKELEELQKETWETQQGGAQSQQAQHVPITTAAHEHHHQHAQESMPAPVNTATSVPVAGTTPYACSNCGASMPDGSVFCPNCGTRRS